LENAARKLRAAYQSGPIAPMRDVLDAADGDSAYAIQAANTAAWVSEGRRIVGRKIGLTSEAVQRQLGVNQPDFGVLFEDMQIASGASLQASRTLQPKAEGEVALIIGRDLMKADASADDIASVVESVAASIEIVDSRIADWKITFADTVADNGSAGFFVLGDARKKIAGLDLYACGMVLEVNDKIVSTGAGAACLGHPLNAAAWLARTLAARGEGLRAGDILLTGALAPMFALTPGDQVRVTIAGLGEARFSYESAR